MSNINIPEIDLVNGNKIPQVGLGTFLMNADECEGAVVTAIELGYRHIDTATVYKNEREVAQGIAKSGVSREDIFLTTKLWNEDQIDPLGGFERSLEQLEQEYVDLYLLHWPLPQRDTAVSAWRGIVEIGESKRAKTVGVCNFEIEHIEQLINETGIVPAVNQIELHPEHQRRELVEYCNDKNIVIEAWGPLAQMKSDLLQKPEITSAAAELDKTPAQVVLRWHVEKGHVLIPKSVNRGRLQENIELFDFALTQEMIAAIDSLETGTNYGPDPFTYNGR